MIGRSIKEYRMPKFLISPTGFNKRNYFYNYHRAIQRAEETSCLYILEGQGDVWKLHESGVRNAVSVFGKSISKEQSNKIKKLAVTHLIVLMDNDQAGREAMVQMKREFGRMYKLTFPKLSDKDVGDMSVYKIKKDILSELKGTY
jgi:DNA primase